METGISNKACSTIYHVTQIDSCSFFHYLFIGIASNKNVFFIKVWMSGMSGLMGFAEIIAISLFLPIEYHNNVQWNITRSQSHFIFQTIYQWWYKLFVNLLNTLIQVFFFFITYLLISFNCFMCFVKSNLEQLVFGFIYN